MTLLSGWQLATTSTRNIMQPQRSTLEKIAELEQTRQALLSDNAGDLATFHNEARLARLAAIKAELDQLWAIERQHRALKRNQQSKSR